MCDDQTEAENARYLSQRRINRRELGIGVGAAAATLLTGCGSTPSATPTSTVSKSPKTASSPSVAADGVSEVGAAQGRLVTIETPDGKAEAFFVAPEGGRYPGVLVWPDVAGLREAFEAMATRLAQQGYAVLVVNPYYRSSSLPVLETFSEWRTEEGRAKIAPMREALTPAAIQSDGAAFVAWLDQQEQVDTSRKIGTTGYCMGGPFTFRTGAAAPGRVGVLGSFHGGGLVTTEPDSPHRLMAGTEVAALICIAENDDARDPDAKSTLRDVAQAAGISAEIEVYPAQHGWCVIDSPVYDESQAERAWSRMLAQFEQHL